MGLDTARAGAAIRLTVGRWTTPEQAQQAADLLATSYKSMSHA
jgi:cysteine sulfinate desulfinase/cysteine desulfurase-like protein